MSMIEQNFEQMRHAMVVSQLRTTGVSDARVVAAMGTVPREAFVPGEKAALAYRDTALPLGNGRALNPPMVVGRLLTEAQVAPGDKVLLIGGATGYTAALLAALGAEVVAVESDTELLLQAQSASTAGAIATGITWVEGPLQDGCAAGAPYALVFVDGAVEDIPQAIVDQMADGGRLVGAIVENGVTRLVTGVRAGTGFGVRAFADADTVRLPGFAKPAVFSF
jgi:protein-L-isoaspartate(D-aspartate) O-methyltransferase